MVGDFASAVLSDIGSILVYNALSLVLSPPGNWFALPIICLKKTPTHMGKDVYQL